MTSARPTSTRIRAVASDVDGTPLTNDKLLTDRAAGDRNRASRTWHPFHEHQQERHRMATTERRSLQTAHDLTEAAADWLCRRTLASEGPFTVRPSGGSTPCGLHEALPAAHRAPSPNAGGSNAH